MVETSYADRLRTAMGLVPLDANGLAKAMNVSPQAVRKVLAGTSHALSAVNNRKAAYACGVNSDWLADATGPMLRAHVSGGEAIVSYGNASPAIAGAASTTNNAIATCSADERAVLDALRAIPVNAALELARYLSALHAPATTSVDVEQLTQRLAEAGNEMKNTKSHATTKRRGSSKTARTDRD